MQQRAQFYLSHYNLMILLCIVEAQLNYVEAAVESSTGLILKNVWAEGANILAKGAE